MTIPNSSSSSSSSVHNASRQSRIPFTLQAVFLASNRGKDVHKPPPQQAACRVFVRNWFLQRQPAPKPSTTTPTASTKFGSNSNHTNKKAAAAAAEEELKLEQQQQQLQQLQQNPTKADDQKPDETETDETEAADETLTKAQDSKLVLSPQAFLDTILCSRGYSTKRYETLRTAYYNKPTPLQEASYDVYLIGLVRKNDVAAFQEIMNCGISTNPCNSYGESIAHMVSRRGRHELLNIMVQAGCSLQIADDYGRTPLHDACWAAEPSYDTVQILLKADSHLLHMVDCRGHVPLNYVRQEHWTQWNQFLESKQEEIWPMHNETKRDTPALVLESSNSRPLPEPENALSPEVAKLVASGRMTPSDAKNLYNEQHQKEVEEEEEDATEVESSTSGKDDDSDYDSDEEDDDDYSEEDSDSCCSSIEDDEEMNELFVSMSSLGFAM